MKAVIKSLKAHQFFTLSFGVAAANIVSFASMPFLARIYGSEAFGIFAIYFAVSTMIGVPSSLRLELAIPIAADLEEASTVSTLAFMLTSCISIALAILFSFEWPRTFFSSAPPGYEVWCLTAVSVFLIGMTQVFVQRSIRLGRIRNMSIRPIVERLAFVAFAFAAFRIGFQVTGLIWAQVIALLLSILPIMAGAMWRPAFDRSSFKTAIHRYSDFPRKNLPSSLLQIASGQVPMLVYSQFFTTAEIGFLSLAQRLTDAPIALLSSSISVVYYRRILLADRGQYRRIFIRTLTLAVVILGVPCLVAGIFADPILDFLFGAKWQASHVFFVLLLPLAFFKMLHAIHQSFFFIQRKLGMELILSLSLFLAQVLGIAIGLYYWNSLVSVVALASNIMALVYFLSLIAIYRITKA